MSGGASSLLRIVKINTRKDRFYQWWSLMERRLSSMRDFLTLNLSTISLLDQKLKLRLIEVRQSSALLTIQFALASMVIDLQNVQRFLWTNLRRSLLPQAIQTVLARRLSSQARWRRGPRHTGAFIAGDGRPVVVLFALLEHTGIESNSFRSGGTRLEGTRDFRLV